MKRITGIDTHRGSRRQAEFAAEYRIGLAGVSYSGTITLEGCRPSRLGGFMTWTLKTIPPGRAVERTVRETVQFLDVEKLLADAATT